MAVSPEPSPSSSTPSSPRVSPITRLRNARLVHQHLQERKWADRRSSISVGSAVHEIRGGRQHVELGAARSMSHCGLNQEPQPPPPHREPVTSAAGLAKDLQRIWQMQQEKGDVASDSLRRRIEKIGASEKDALVLHLLQHTSFLEAQRNDVVAVGEKLTTQLVQQQHELRVQFKAQTSQLHEQLQQALHHHPEVARLEEKIAELQDANRECEQQLLFAVQKLHRSRQRERALRLEQESDPLLWGL